MSTYVTADHHFGHENIIHLCHRPFASVEEMNRVLIERWNEKVQPKDTVYLLGDVFVKMTVREAQAIRSKLNGNIHLICGNHDEVARSMANAWGWVKDLYSLNLENFKAVLSHYPLRSWAGSHRGVANLHGHSHGNLSACVFAQIDVGVDCHDFYPLPVEAVKALLDLQENPPPVEFDAPPSVAELNDLIRHMWVNDGMTRNGFRTMSQRQKDIYQTVIQHKRAEPWLNGPSAMPYQSKKAGPTDVRTS